MTLPPLVWKPSPNFSERTAAVDKIVLHDCQGGYEGSIATFMSPTGAGNGPVSAHLVLKADGSEVTQMVAYDKKAWHCRAFNSSTIGLEMAGFAERGYPNSEWDAAARIIAYLLHCYSLPVRWAHGGQGAGFCSHFDLGKAGGGHSDPTTDQHVWAGFVGRVEAAYAAGIFPTEPWGRGLPALPNSAPSAAPDNTKFPHDTLWYQVGLNAIGYRPLLTADGVLGPKTGNTIARFQVANGIYATGKPDTRTEAALVAALGNLPKH